MGFQSWLSQMMFLISWGSITCIGGKRVAISRLTTRWVKKKDHRISGSEVFDTFTIQYANSVSVDDSGVVSLKNPTSATIQCEFGSGDADEINKVPTGSFMMSDRFPNEHAIYYKSADA